MNRRTPLRVRAAPLRQRGSVGGHRGAVDDQGNRKRHVGARLGVELLDLDDVTDGDFVLLTAGLDDCVGRHGYVYLFWFFRASGSRELR